MRNKQHKFILKAFLEAEIPTGIYESEYKPELISIDSVVGGIVHKSCEEEKSRIFQKAE